MSEKELTTRELADALYKGTDNASHFAKEVMQPVLRGQINMSEKEEAIVGTYLRMCGCIHTMVKMNDKGSFQGTSMTARTLFELLLDIKLLADDKQGELVNKFHKFPLKEKYRVAKNIVDFYDTNESIEPEHIAIFRSFIKKTNEELDLDSYIREYWGETNNGKPARVDHWSGINSIRERACILGSKYEELYINAYPFLSWYIHSGSTCYVKLTEETLERIFGMSHIIALDVFLKATRICAEEMKIAQGIEWFNKAVEDLKLTSAWILFGEEAIKELGMPQF